MTRKIATVMAAAGFVLTAGCGIAPDLEQTSQAVHNESEIRAALGDEDGNSWVRVDGARCEIVVVLKSSAEVSLYADAGDTVATNPSRTAGVKVGGAERATCMQGFTDALAGLD